MKYLLLALIMTPQHIGFRDQEPSEFYKNIKLFEATRSESKKFLKGLPTLSFEIRLPSAYSQSIERFVEVEFIRSGGAPRPSEFPQLTITQADSFNGTPAVHMYIIEPVVISRSSQSILAKTYELCYPARSSSEASMTAACRIAINYFFRDWKEMNR